MSKTATAKTSEAPAAPESSRLIIKCIPKHITEARLKDHFGSQGGHVTDVRIMKNEDGNSRLFGFVGFATTADAVAALKFFNRTYLDTSKLIVEYARPKGDNGIPRAWSKYSEGSSRHTALHKEKEGEPASKKRGSDKMATADDDVTAGMSDAKKRKLEEFLDISTKKNGRLWQNDGAFEFDEEKGAKGAKKATPTNGKKTGEAEAKSDEKKKKKRAGDDIEKPTEKDIKKMLKEQVSDSESDDDEYQDFSKLRKTSDNQDEDEYEDEDEDDEVEDSEETDQAKKSSSKMDVDQDDDELPALEPVDDGKNKNKKSKKEDTSKISKHGKVDTALVADTGRLFVRNLPFAASEDDVRKLFSRFGEVSEVHLSIDKLTKRSKGFGFVLFLFPAHAIEAKKQLDGTFFQGRILHILPAMEAETVTEDSTAPSDQSTKPKPKTPGPQIGSAVSGSTGFVSEYQKRKQEKQKSLANQDYNWNSLFIRPDAVASAMATSLSVSKSDLLDPESSSSMAVRLALGETNIIKETKTFLEAEGISLDALKGHYNKDIVRSPTVLLVKNIPTNTQVEELRNVFGRFGELLKVVMPPSRTLSVIEFAAPTEARAAFKHLAYKQFKDAPLFLEWAPIGVLGSEKDRLQAIPDSISKSTTTDVSSASTEIEVSEQVIAATDKKNSKKTSKEATSSDTKAKDEGSGATVPKMGAIDELVEENSQTLFVKNLSFATSEDSLRTLVERLLGPINNVSIATHKVKGETLSQGYGFIECKSREQAVKAWKQLQGSMLDGHQLQVSFSQPKAGATSLSELQQLATKRKTLSGTQPESTKIMVKNVPFEATRHEIRDLFTPFGELRSVRLPNKPGGKGHRGFAFVEFVTPDEAAAAIEALGTTHLYNRRLVIDYAEQDGDVEAIRAKTAAQFEN